MSADPGDQPSFRVDLTREEALAFLTRLAEDDDFRRRYEEATSEALREHGIDGPLPAAGVRPPAKENIRRIIEAVRSAPDDCPDELWGFWCLGVGFGAVAGFGIPGFGPFGMFRPPGEAEGY
jgi:hypothetical protein